MKTVLKAVIGAFFLPFLGLAGVVAFLRVVFVSTFGLVWQISDEWYGSMLGQVNDFMQWLKK